ncbi:hypothetical protein Tco_1310976 [Tanacetum coccineum]
MDEEATYEEDEANELYRDVNVNLEGKDTEMTDAPLPNVVLFTNIEEHSLSATTLPHHPLILLITSATNTSTSLQDFAKYEKTVNEQLKAEVMTRSSIESKTSLAIAANLSELELKKILIDKMERNKLIHIFDEQKNLYKALVDAYESDKLILNTYGDTVSFKRRRDDEDKDKEPSTRSNQGSKRRRVGKEPESTSAPKEKTSKTSGKSYEGSKSQHKTTGESAQIEEPMHTTKDLEEPITGTSNGLKIWSLTECGVKCRESARDVYSKCRIIAITKLEIVDWHNYKHLDWITVRKLTNLTVEEHLAFKVSLRMFTRSVVIQRRMEDLQLGNKDKKNRLMHIDELHKFSDGTLNDVRTALNDRLKGIQMDYLPQTI